MLQRMIFERIETRILVGITAFVAIMLLVGWVAINENARMSSFERQHLARSIERGGELFATNCSSCHGTDGRGNLGRAPGFNSPHFFGHDYLAPVERQLQALDEEEVALNNELAELADELVADGTTEERQDEIVERRLEISERVSGEEGIVAERAALITERDQIISQLQGAVDNGYPLGFALNSDGEQVLAYQPSRLNQVGWASTHYDFIFSTLVHGRPGSDNYWQQPMVSWAQIAGGSLRNDQLGDIANYILNWDKGNNWTIEDALAVRQYAKLPVEAGAGGVVSDIPPIGTDVEAILTRLEEQEISGDATRGEALYAGQQRTELNQALACSGCHTGGVIGPTTAGTWHRVENERLTLNQFADYTPEQYIIESIVLPGDYVVPGYVAGQMPEIYGAQMSLQDIADVVAYLATLTESE